MPQYVTVLKIFLGVVAFSSPLIAQIDDRGYPDQRADDFSFGNKEPYLTSDIDVPAVRDRAEGPSIEVTEFRFDAVPEFPDLGITRQSVEVEAEKLRRQFTEKPNQLDSGFTPAELNVIAERLPEIRLPDDVNGSYAQADLEEIGDYILSISQGRQRKKVSDYEVKGLARLVADLVAEQEVVAEVDLSVLDASLMTDLIAVIRRQRAERGLSYSELEEVAAAITRFYRSRGVFLAQAYIPVQTVDAGVVTLSVLEGKLGTVVVKANKKYSAELLAKSFDGMLGMGVRAKSIEEELYLLNDYPGLGVYGFFAAGESFGETALNLQVNEEKSWRVTVKADNHGSRFTGDNRLYTAVDWLNPTGAGDQLTLGYLKSWDPLNSDVALFQYRLPLFSNRTQVYVAADKNEFTVEDPSDPTIQQLELQGTNTNFRVGLDQHLVRTRQFSLTLGGALTDKKTEFESSTTDLSDLGVGAHVQGTEININFSTVSEYWKLLNMGYVTLQYGDHKENSELRSDDGFYKFAMDYSLLKFFNIPFTSTESRFIVRSKLRYSESDLPAFEQLPLGGADAVRAFTVSEFSADQAAYLGAEWYVDMPRALNTEIFDGTTLNDLMEVALFVDGAYGSVNEKVSKASDTWANMAGVGLLFKFNWKSRIGAELSFSKPVSSKSGAENFGNDADSIQTYLKVTFMYDG